MSINNKNKILKGAVTTAALAGIVMPAGEIGATTVVSDSQKEEVKTQGVVADNLVTNDSNSGNVTAENLSNDNSSDTENLEVGITDSNITSDVEVTVDEEVSNENSNDSSNKPNFNILNTATSNIKTKSNLPGVPYFYYWTGGDVVVLSWDYGHAANRPSKIEAVVDKDFSFSNPQYIKVKAKGAEFVAPYSGDFYLRVRFMDSAGNVTHESVRKVVRNSTETREVKGLRYKASGTGVKVEWNVFTSGIKSGQVIVDNKLYSNLSLSDIKSNSVFVDGVKEGSEIKIKIIGNNGLEYNGVVFVEKGTFSAVSDIGLGLSDDGVGIRVDFINKQKFTKGTKLQVGVIQKSTKDVIIKEKNIVLDANDNALILYPDAGKTFMNDDYIVTVKDLTTGETYTYDYPHELFEVDSMVAAGLGDGKVVTSWSKMDGVALSELVWSTREDFSDYTSVEVGSGKTGVSFDTNLVGGKTVYLLLTNYDKEGRILSQSVSSVVVGNTETKLSNFKGVYKNDTSAEFSWDKIPTNVVAGMVTINNDVTILTNAELKLLNSLNALTIGGFTKGTKYDVHVYLVDSTGKVYTAGVPNISEQSGSQDGSVVVEGVSGINAKYSINSGTLSLALDQATYDVAANSTIEILINGQKTDSVTAVYSAGGNTVNVTGLIPTKEYKNISLSYVNKNGENKTINIPTLSIIGGSPLDLFLVNSYNKAVSRDTVNIDEQGYNYWKSGLLDKSITLSYFIRNFANVPEFMNLVNSPQDLVNRLYNVLVLRDPDPQGLQFWTSVYNQLISNGVSHKEAIVKILVDMTTSGEFADLASKMGVNP